MDLPWEKGGILHPEHVLCLHSKPIPAMTTLQELIAQKDALLRQQQEIAKSIAEFQSAQRAGVINEIKTLMAQHGITADELLACADAAMYAAKRDGCGFAFHGDDKQSNPGKIGSA